MAARSILHVVQRKKIPTLATLSRMKATLAISEAKNLNRANLGKPETDAALEIARKPKEKKNDLV